MNTFDTLITENKLVLVDFHALWCGPCKTMAPILQELKSKHKTGLKILKIDIDKNQGLSNKLKITGVPTLILYKMGKPVWRQSGVTSLHQLDKIIKENT